MKDKREYYRWAGIAGAEIRKHRLKKDIPQHKLAELAGLKQASISLLENGERIPSLPTLLNLSAALGISLSKLVQAVETKY